MTWKNSDRQPARPWVYNSGMPEKEPDHIDDKLKLEPVKDILTRWDVAWSEIMAANPEQLRSYLANMNEQVRRLYELRTLEMEVGRPLTKEEGDLTLHSEKAGHDDNLGT